MDYQQFYDFIAKEIERLKSQNILNDYRLCKALAACYELQEYVAGQIGNRIANGEIEDY